MAHSIVQQWNNHDVQKRIEETKCSCRHQDVDVTGHSEHLPDLNELKQVVAENLQESKDEGVTRSFEVLNIQRRHFEKTDAVRHIGQLLTVKEDTRDHAEHTHLPPDIVIFQVPLVNNLQVQEGDHDLQENIEEGSQVNLLHDLDIVQHIQWQVPAVLVKRPLKHSPVEAESPGEIQDVFACLDRIRIKLLFFGFVPVNDLKIGLLTLFLIFCYVLIFNFHLHSCLWHQDSAVL